ncbi:putative bifunctional diguanylate cyclase/phosphodiesterase [Saccharothrix obliqua]|uniref:putative bifunctional diguanylate cyclase/phosphodiesterase n=1 Tax=Saccharothrix obliqua TaxID=2861747 RepID=UPI001C5D054D|nr:EAL domain-containing protein [Saccharothrix obliqua]MBW4716440.1 diguanylate cyclase [Saccharothrix obliqua]
MADPLHRPDTEPSAPVPDPARERELLARKWAYRMGGAIVVPHTREQLDCELRGRLDALCDALHAEPLAADALERLGEELVGMGYVGEHGLRRTTDVLGRGLLGLSEFQPVPDHAERIATGLGALAAGFLAANRRAVFEQQESMQLTLLKAVRDAKWRLQESEARFDQVVTSSASGVLIVDLAGNVVRANAAISEILGRSAAELTERTLFDLVHPDSVTALREAMKLLLEGGHERIRQSQRLLRSDGDVARITLTTSLLRDADDKPAHFVTVVEDGTELMLLQGELNRQALHDVLTGLPNRQFFSTYLESALRRADPVHGVTLLHLDIDAFGMVCNSLGSRAGERLLVHVAQRLKAALSAEKAMVARFEGDGFGVLVENTEHTPDVARMVAAINEELAEPTFVDGHGLAVSASIGVVRRPPRDQEPAELLRAADQALRRAKAGRRGQWELFHPRQDAADRREQAMAVGMPGAWENGEIGVRYRPVTAFAGGVVGVEAVLHWDHPERVVPHAECVALAEETGLVLPLGAWVLRVAGGQARWWAQRGGFTAPLVVHLTPVQSGDADLVSRVVRALEETGLRPERLVVGMPVGVLPVAEAVDNLTVLADMGVGTALHDFGLGPADLAALADLPVRTVRVAARLVDHRAPYVPALVSAARDSGVAVVVDGVRTEEQAAWWREAGADAGSGEHFGAPCPPGDVVAHFG